TAGARRGGGSWMRWISKRRALAAVVAAGAACALAVPAAGIGSRAGSGLPTKIGKGEGALNLIEWPAYSDPSFAKPFERQTGCKIKRKDAGSSNQMVALMHTGGGGGGGQYDLVSASGDASLRLIYGHDGVSLQWGPNTLLYNTRKVKPAPTSWSAIYSPRYKGKVSIPNNPIQIADAAL